MADTQTIKQRDSWGSRAAFVLAAIGSAVGLGNLWGFPYKLYAYGGGAFLVPYFVAMLVIGLPLLIMEFAVGHWAQNSAPGSFERILRRHRFVGWWLSLLAFIIITYYVVILAYCTIYLWQSLGGMFGQSLPWTGDSEAAGAYFQSVYGAGEAGGPHWPVVLGSLITWLLIYFCLFRGVKWVSKVVLFTVPLPWLMLVVLTVRGLTLEGSQTGLSFYLDPDWSKLGLASTWQMAFGQVFFSLSLGFAVMLSYASFLHRRSDLNNNAAIIALGDLATSFVAGLAVFGTLGALAFTQGTAVEEVIDAGPGLAFVSFPYALAQLPDGVAAFSFIFFIALLTLGIDSAFSIVEAVQAAVNDNKKKWWRGAWTLPTVCGVGFVLSILYTLRGVGLDWLGLIDAEINGPFGILSVALAECLVVGYAWKGEFLLTMRAHANERSDWKLGAWWDIIVRYIAPALLMAIIAWSMADWVRNEQWPEVIAAGVFALVPLVILWLMRGGQEPDAPEPVGSDRQHGVSAATILGLPVAAGLLGLLVGLALIGPTRRAADAQWLGEQRKLVALTHEALAQSELPTAERDRLVAVLLPLEQELAEREPETLATDRPRLEAALARLAEATPQQLSDAVEEAATAPFVAKDLGGTAYAVLAIAMIAISGGLALCFFKAIQAASSGDTAYDLPPADDPDAPQTDTTAAPQTGAAEGPPA